MLDRDVLFIPQSPLSRGNIYVLQDIGTGKVQEDSVNMYHNEFIALADGVGKSPFGRDAAFHATEKATWYYNSAKRKSTALKDKKLFGERMFRSVNTSILKEKQKKGNAEGFCTTLTVMLFGIRHYYIFHVGDCAVYQISKAQVVRLTPVHRDPTNGYLTKWIGGDTFLPTILSGSLSDENIFLLASDGLWDWVTSEDIYTQLYAKKNESDPLTSLMNLAIAYGSKDNKTAILVSI